MPRFGLRETLKVLGLQAGAVWVREGARLKLAKTIGMQPGEEEEFSESGRSGQVKVVEVSSGPAESRVDRIAGEWSAIRAELRTKGVDSDVITAALADIDAGAERERAEQLVRDKLRREKLGDDDDTKVMRRLVGMLARRGYGQSMAVDVVTSELANERERRRV